MENMFNEEDMKKAIELARKLKDTGKNNEYDVENILGSGDNTYGIVMKYTPKRIIDLIKGLKTF